MSARFSLFCSVVAGLMVSSALAVETSYPIVSFSATAAPKTAPDMASFYTTSALTLTYRDGSQKHYPLAYHKLFGVKDRIGSHAAGQLFNAQMQPLKDHLGQAVIAETPDGNSLLNIDGKLSLITHYEYDWLNSDGSRAVVRQPMSMTLTQLSQDAQSGKLTATQQAAIPVAKMGGVWIPCGASQTPWNTHLGSEEDYDLQYNPLNQNLKKGYAKTLSGVEVMKNVYGFSHASPYQYGYLTEVTVDKSGKAEPVKHYGLGRGTWEMGKVMPDNQTVYLGDDGSHVALFMFVARVPAQLDKGGKLYAAKFTQTSDQQGGKGSLSWVLLGESQSNEQIKALADTHTFDDIFENHAFDTQTQACTAGSRVRAGSSADECLVIKPGKETAAAFLESRRTAALLGATVEFNKLEGIAWNHADKKLYVAASYIDGAMLKNDSAPSDQIQLPKLSAGATFTLDTQAKQVDAAGQSIDSDYVATNLYVEPALLGEDMARDNLGNTAHPDKVANPDNLFFSEAMRTLFIGEDSSMHVNNFVWAYHVDRKQLTRILSVPVGAEATGLQVVDNINGHAYIMSNSQHHGDWKPATTDHAIVTEALKEIDKFNANVGYVGGLPAIK